MSTFYKSNKDYSRVLRQIDESDKITKGSKKTIHDFVERLLAEGISHARIKKYLIILRKKK